MKVRIRAIAAAAAIAVIAAGAAACSSGGGSSSASQAVQATSWRAQPSDTASPQVSHPSRQSPPMDGVFIEGGSTALATFTQQTGVQPKIVLNFGGWDKSFMSNWASSVTASGGIPLMQVGMGKKSTDVALIASGADDAYLISYAKEVRDFGHPLILSFGHEMNGTWYQWGWKHTSATTFVAAWRHIVNIFREEGATNVTWLWTIQAYADSPSHTANPTAWWPGSDYVTWVGVDGHYLYKGETFDKIFYPVLKEVERITTKPILIAETAISPALGQVTMLRDLMKSVAADNLLGFVYFDHTGNADYRLKSAAALGAYGAAAKEYGYSN